MLRAFLNVVGDRGFELLNAPEVVSIPTIQESTLCSCRNEKTRLSLRIKRVHLNVVGDREFEPVNAPDIPSRFASINSKQKRLTLGAVGFLNLHASEQINSRRKITLNFRCSRFS